ncbi:MAG: methyl-accepting chemotaxis protein [Proteobacteria bacterium]|nr:methyl-accepting chemotaxis protein [Pseudomonadota bacterium]MBU4294831.1 methyl-accepting chemotaxis protein [Pseudomonadota bacterium]MCG2749331.1 methyl-accepting chemotaxis protein [Desulfobulbaceae bacterium]
MKAWLGPGKAAIPDSAGAIDLGCEEWIGQLRLVSSRLGSMSASTEDEFLAIGERLQDFYQRAGEITTIISSLVNRLGGGQSSAAMGALAEILNDLEDHLDEARKEEGRKSLVAILQCLDRVGTPLGGFGRVNKSLMLLGVYTKIESSRLGENSVGFEALTKAVAVLSDEIIGKVDTILLQKDQLAETIRNALADVVNMGVEKQGRIHAVLGKTGQSLQALTSIVERCSSSAGTISLSSSVVEQNLGQVVVSLQTHDRVRQQIEHVAEILNELADRLPGPGAPQHPNQDERDYLVMESGIICEIQAAQLRHASMELQTAVESIIVNLREISAMESGMSKETVDLVGLTDQAGASFFNELGNDLTEVIAMLTAASATSRDLSVVMSAAAGTVGEIFHFVGDIENIVYAIKLIALNFLIQAEAMGGGGGGLGVLADAISRLSLEAREQAEEVTGILAEIKSLTDGMCQSVSDEASVMEGRVVEMRQEVEGILASLREINEEMAGGLTRAHAMVVQLSADIEEVVGGVTVHQKVAAVIEEAETILGAVTRSAKALLPADKWSLEAEKFRAADTHYTMHSERDIHAVVLNAQPNTPEATDSQPLLAPPGEEDTGSSGGSDDLGDNVELF